MALSECQEKLNTWEMNIIEYDGYICYNHLKSAVQFIIEKLREETRNRNFPGFRV